MRGVNVSGARVRFGRTSALGLVLGLALAGCSSGSSPMASFTGMFGSSKPAEPAANAVASAAPIEIDCPSIDVRSGASTYQVSANPADQSAMNMRYQVGIGQTARECRVVGNTVVMKIGVQGRVILGPAGGPGQLDVPLRFAVVHEGPEPKPITTKLQRLKVSIPEGNTNVLFTHVEDDLSFPLPRGNDIDHYIVYIGFDPLAVQQQPRRPERRAPRRSQG